MPIILPFAEWDYAAATKVAPEIPESALGAQLFYDGDHWQDGAGWIGPMPTTGGSGVEAVMAEIAKAFTSRNAVSEVVDRHVRGVIGQEPGWTVVLRRSDTEDVEPTDDELGRIAEAEELLLRWWNERQAHARMQEATARVLTQGRGPLRLFVPRGLMEEGDGGATVVNADGPEDALRYIHLSAPAPGTAFLFTDPRTGWQVGVALLEDDDGKRAEVSYRDPDDGTVTNLRVISEDGAEEFPGLPLGGNTLVHEMRRSPLVTLQVQQAQKALNLALSMLPRNVVTGGFLERVILNGQMPGKWVEDASVEGGRRFEPSPMYFGSARVNWIQGIPVKEETEDGERLRLTTPSVQWRDPVPVDTPIDAKREHYRDILGEVDQLHVLMNEDANASGRSREQARADYVASLDRTRTEVEASGRWLLTSVLALAETFGGSEGRYTEDLRVEFTCHIDPGPISVEERAQNVTEAEANLLSRETAMQRNGVDDPAAELAAIAGQDDALLATRERQGEALDVLTRAGMGLESAARLLGMDEDDLAIIRQDQGGGQEGGQGGAGGGGVPPIEQ